MRYTKADIRGMFSRLTKAMGKREGELVLDYAPIYGGYVIEELEPNGGCSHPFASVRRSAREMYLSMHMAAQLLENQAWEKQQSERKEV